MDVQRSWTVETLSTIYGLGKPRSSQISPSDYARLCIVKRLIINPTHTIDCYPISNPNNLLDHVRGGI